MKPLALLFLTLQLLAAPALAENFVADIMNVAGTVTITRTDAKTPAEAGGQLQTGDILATGPDGSAGISFADGSRVSVGGDSELRVDTYLFEPQDKQYGMEVFLRKGVAVVSTGKMARFAPDAMKVSTPLATLGIRGTKFLVKVK